MKTLTVKIPEDLDEKISAIAKRRKTSRSAVVRAALETIGENEQPTFGELARRFRGILEGPGDLSTNKRYFEGFGK